MLINLLTYMLKENYTYFVVISLVVLGCLFGVVFFWGSYMRGVVVGRQPDQGLEFVQSEDLIIRPAVDDPLITSAREVYRTLVGEDDALMGDRAKLEDRLLIVEFGDFTDEKTRGLQNNIDKLIGKYRDRIIFVWKDFPLPFNAESRNVALAARCAQDQGEFWKYVDLVWQEEEFSQSVYLSLAGQVGLDVAKFGECYENKEKMDLIGQNMDQAQNYGVTGVPYLFIGGKRFDPVDKGYEYEDLERIVESELE